MKEKLRFLGLDVHAETIAVAVAESDGEVRSLGTIPNRAESIRKMIKKLGPAEKNRTSALMLRFFDLQVNLSTDQGRIKEIEVTARMTG